MQVVGKDVFRRVEKELYSYPGYLIMLQEQRQDILYATPRRETEGRAIGHVSDPTLARGIKLAGLAEGDTGRWANLIQYALSQLPREQQQLVKYKYFDGMKNDLVGEKLYISRRVFYVWREDIILYIVLLATQRGLLRPLKDKSAAPNV